MAKTLTDQGKNIVDPLTGVLIHVSGKGHDGAHLFGRSLSNRSWNFD
jgi:hypothetical protein